MLGHRIKHANITGIANGAKVSGVIPATGVHTGLLLRCLASGSEITVAQMKADILDVTIRLDGEEIVTADGTFLLARQQYYGARYGAANVNGILPIDYTRPYLATPAEQIRTALGMQGVDSYTIEIDLGAALTLDTIEVYSYRLAANRPLGEHLRIRRLPLNFSTIAGTHEITSMPGLRDNNIAYLAMHYYEATANCDFDQVTVIANDKKVHSEVPLALNQVMLEAAGRDPQSGFYHVDFALMNDYASRLRMGTIYDFRQEVTFSGTAAVGSYYTYLEQLVDIGDESGGFQQTAA